jgi:Uri superfamily endonuclease
MVQIMNQSHPKATDNGLLHPKAGTYALILHCLNQRSIDTGTLGNINVRKGYYVYVGSAFGSGGVLARIKHHWRISESFHWHIDYLRPAVEITKVWVSYDPMKREHQWAGIFREIPGVQLPFRGFGSSDCQCDAHLFFFNTQPSVKMFRTRIERAIPSHHGIERIDGNALRETFTKCHFRYE